MISIKDITIPKKTIINHPDSIIPAPSSSLVSLDSRGSYVDVVGENGKVARHSVELL